MNHGVYNVRLLNMDGKVVEVDDQSVDGSSDGDEDEGGGGKFEDMPMEQEIDFSEERRHIDSFMVEQQKAVAEMQMEKRKLHEALWMVGEQVRDTTAKVARETGSVMEKLQEKFTFVPKGPKEEKRGTQTDKLDSPS